MAHHIGDAQLEMAQGQADVFRRVPGSGLRRETTCAAAAGDTTEDVQRAYELGWGED